MGEEGAIGPQKAGDRAQRPGFARPSGPGATLRGRSLAPWRLQPGCELGLRRTLLAARGRYSLSLCLSASAAAARRPALFRFPLLPNIASQAPTSHREGFCSSFPWGPWGSENRKERERHTERKRDWNKQKLRYTGIMLHRVSKPQRGDVPTCRDFPPSAPLNASFQAESPPLHLALLGHLLARQAVFGPAKYLSSLDTFGPTPLGSEVTDRRSQSQPPRSEAAARPQLWGLSPNPLGEKDQSVAVQRGRKS